MEGWKIKMMCCICWHEIEKKYSPDGRVLWNEGNNAQPVKEGRCCDYCNSNFVIPERIRSVKMQEKHSKKEKGKKEMFGIQGIRKCKHCEEETVITMEKPGLKDFNGRKIAYWECQRCHRRQGRVI